MITALSGGTGSVKLIRGLATLEEELVVVVNVGDNIFVHGLYVAPDLDTVIYGLAGLLDEERGWGLRRDTFNFLDQMDRFGAETWFNLGDRDLALHTFRTSLVRDNQSLSKITDRISDRLGVTVKVIPASDDHLQTRIRVEGEEIHFQEYWVKRKGRDTVLGVNYQGAGESNPAPGIIDAIRSSECVILCPANPITSIGPILAVPGIREELTKNSAKVVAVSPIIGETPVSGPAGKLMSGLGLEINPIGVCRLFSDFLESFVIDHRDEAYRPGIEALGVRTFLTDILMRDNAAERSLADFVLRSSRSPIQ